MADSLVLQAGLGVISANPIVITSDAIGLTVVKVALPDITLPQFGGGVRRIFRVTITNPNSAATLAWMTVDRGAAAPTIAATYAAAPPSGSPVLPLTSTTVGIYSDKDLYIVSDTAAQKFAVTVSLF